MVSSTDSTAAVMTCVVRYDNETGKGDHRHYGNSEEPYSFELLDKLIADFRYDCTRLTDWCWE